MGSQPAAVIALSDLKDLSTDTSSPSSSRRSSQTGAAAAAAAAPASPREITAPAPALQTSAAPALPACYVVVPIHDKAARSKLSLCAFRGRACLAFGVVATLILIITAVSMSLRGHGSGNSTPHCTTCTCAPLSSVWLCVPIDGDSAAIDLGGDLGARSFKTTPCLYESCEIRPGTSDAGHTAGGVALQAWNASCAVNCTALASGGHKALEDDDTGGRARYLPPQVLRSCQDGSERPVIDELRFLLPGNASSSDGDARSPDDAGGAMTDKGGSLVNVTQGSMNSLYHMYPMFAYAAWAGPLQCTSRLVAGNCGPSSSGGVSRPERPDVVW